MDDDFDLDAILDQSLDDLETSYQVSTNTNHTTNTENKNENTNGTVIDDSLIIEEALNAVQESISNANEAQSQNSMNDFFEDSEMKDFFNQIFESFSNLEDDENSNNNNSNGNESKLDEALKKIMGNFFDCESLTEPVQIIVQKFPKWLAANHSKLSAKEYSNYEKQYNLYLQANELLTNENTKGTEKVMDLLLETFSYGSLPSEVMDGMMPKELQQIAEQIAHWDQSKENVDDIKTNSDSDSNTTANANMNINDIADMFGGQQSTNNESQEDVGNDEAMLFFQQLMGMDAKSMDKNSDNNTSSNSSSNANYDDFRPNLEGMPKLDSEEMKQFQEMMNRDDCILM